MRRIPPGSMYYMCLTASIETRNPNAVLIGTKFGFLNYGGRYKTRTCDLPHVKRMRYQLRQSSIPVSFFII